MTTSWKQLLSEAESLTKANGANAWRTAQIVRELLKDRNFLDEACDQKLDERDSRLQVFSSRFAIGLNEMIQMIEHFPDLKDWESGRLDVLRSETCRLIAQRRAKAVVKNTDSPLAFQTRTAAKAQSPVAQPQLGEVMLGKQSFVPQHELERQNQIVFANKLIALIESGKLDRQDAELMSRLQHLSRLLEDLVNASPFQPKGSKSGGRATNRKGHAGLRRRQPAMA